MKKREMGVPVTTFDAVPYKVSKKLDIEKLQDAVVDGKLVVSVGQRMIVERTTWKKGKCIPTLSMCVVKSIEDDVTVYLMDETRQQIFVFNPKANDLPRMKVWRLNDEIAKD